MNSTEYHEYSISVYCAQGTFFSKMNNYRENKVHDIFYTLKVLV